MKGCDRSERRRCEGGIRGDKKCHPLENELCYVAWKCVRTCVGGSSRFVGGKVVGIPAVGEAVWGGRRSTGRRQADS